MALISLTRDLRKKDELCARISDGDLVLFEEISRRYLRGSQYILGDFSDVRETGKTPRSSQRRQTPRLLLSSAYRLHEASTHHYVKLPHIEPESKLSYPLATIREIVSGSEDIVSFLSSKETFKIYADFVARMRFS